MITFWMQYAVGNKYAMALAYIAYIKLGDPYVWTKLRALVS